VCRELPIAWTVPSPEFVFEAMSRGGVRTAAVLRAQTPGALEKSRGEIQRTVETFAKAGDFVIPMPAVLASARK
jgi:hypothetical protein